MFILMIKIMWYSVLLAMVIGVVASMATFIVKKIVKLYKKINELL